MANHDFECQGCGSLFEQNVPYPKMHEGISCIYCGQLAVMVWRRAPFMSPDPYWHPQYDPQLGVEITSKAQKEEILRSRNLTTVSKEEFTRRFESQADAEPQLDRQALRDAAEKAWNDVKNGNVPPVHVPTVDDVEAGKVR